jgi:hypothetical protein
LDVFFDDFFDDFLLFLAMAVSPCWHKALKPVRSIYRRRANGVKENLRRENFIGARGRRT